MIVEDDETMRERLARVVLANRHLCLLQSCPDASTGSRSVLEHRPDILLVDLGLPDGSGLDLIGLIAREGLATRAIVVTVFEDDSNIMRALSAGASGYILKDDDTISIDDAIDIILSGGAPISPVIARHILDQFSTPALTPSDPNQPEHDLTRREKEILVLVSSGFSDREIAEREGISYHTVTTHIKKIYKKLSISSRVAATRMAVQIGLVDPESFK